MLEIKSLDLEVNGRPVLKDFNLTIKEGESHVLLGLMLSDTARIYSVPELEATVKDAELSHEAAVGRISEEEIAYLTVRGLSEEEAAGAIIRGFLNVDIEGLPAALGAQVRRMSAEALG
jgi:hypothetical protein